MPNQLFSCLFLKSICLFQGIWIPREKDGYIVRAPLLWVSSSLDWAWASVEEFPLGGRDLVAGVIVALFLEQDQCVESQIWVWNPCFLIGSAAVLAGFFATRLNALCSCPSMSHIQLILEKNTSWSYMIERFQFSSSQDETKANVNVLK